MPTTITICIPHTRTLAHTLIRVSYYANQANCGSIQAHLKKQLKSLMRWDCQANRNRTTVIDLKGSSCFPKLNYKVNEKSLR